MSFYIAMNCILFLRLRRNFTLRVFTQSLSTSKKDQNGDVPACNSKDRILRPFAKCNPKTSNSKISVIGLGNVGNAVTAALLLQGITNEVAFTDMDSDKVKMAQEDYEQMSTLLAQAKVYGSTEFDVVANSKICILTAGVRPNPGDSRISVLGKNAKLLTAALKKAIQYMKDGIFLVALNPVDVMTYITAHVTGYPPEKVIGSGCNLDTARLRCLMSEKYGAAIESCEGWVLGEHGLSSMTAWSTCTVGGAFITDVNPKMGSSDDEEKWSEVHQAVTQHGPNINKLKGYTNWGIALSMCAICHAILYDTKTVHAVTVPAKGFYGIKDNVYMSLPAVIGRNGILDIVELPLTESECANLHKSGKYLLKHQEELKL